MFFFLKVFYAIPYGQLLPRRATQYPIEPNLIRPQVINNNQQTDPSLFSIFYKIWCEDFKGKQPPPHLIFTNYTHLP